MPKYLTQKELELALEECLDELNDCEQVDAVYIPPEVDELTDEEHFTDEPEKVAENENVDIVGTFEIHTNEEDLYDTSDDEILASKKKRLCSIPLTDKKINWKAGQFIHQHLPVSKEDEIIMKLKSEFGDLSPLQMFLKFFDDDVQDMIVQFSIKYAQDNNRHDYVFPKEDLLKFVGILIISGYHTLPQEHMFWSTDEDKGVQIVKDCMSKNKYKSIKRNLHLSDNSKLDKKDKFSKLRPFFDIMNEKFMQFDVFSHNLAIDEQMVPYFGRHSCKMFLKGKPVRFGFKLWCICSSQGYLYKFIPYGGANPDQQKSEYGLGAQTVLDLLSIVKNKNNHNIFFDNFFSSFKLFSILKDRGYFATGTIRENRTSGCPLQTVKSISKKSRGFYDSQFEQSSEVALVRWNDNSVVTLISTHYNVEPLKTAKRYDRKQKETKNIPQPLVVHEYNKYMGGVDIHDNGVANYRIRIMGKKWWWPLFVNTLDSALVNAWKLYNTVNDNKINQLDFRSFIALRLLKSRKSKPIPVNVPEEVRLDQSRHVIIKEESRRRCRVCHSQTIYMCRTCNVYLHTTCFEKFHTQ